MPKFRQTRPIEAAPHGTPAYTDRTESRVVEAESQPITAPWPFVPTPDGTPVSDWTLDAPSGAAPTTTENATMQENPQ